MSSPVTLEAAVAAWITRWGNRNEKIADWAVPLLSAAAGVCYGLVGPAWGLIFPAIALTLLAAFMQIAETQWSKKKRATVDGLAAETLQAARDEANNLFDGAVSQHNLLADTFEQVARFAANMPSQTPVPRKATFDKALTQLLDSIKFVYKVPGLRAVVYELAEDGAQLSPYDYTAVGIRQAPKAFVRGTDRGDKAIALVLEGGHMFVDDISSAPEKWAGSGTGYNTFVSAAITSPDIPFGMLTVDAPNTDDITEDIVHDVRLIAGIAAMMFAELRRP